MKKAINAWSGSRRYILQKPVFQQIAAAGFDGVELNLDADDSSSHSLTMATSAAQLVQIQSWPRPPDSADTPSVSTSLYGQQSPRLARPGNAGKGERHRPATIRTRQCIGR